MTATRVEPAVTGLPPSLDPWRFWRSLMQGDLASAVAGGVAPNTLVQPILPGWTLNINSHNSSAPQTEAAIVSQHSYGRQIGRIADALHALIAGLFPDGAPAGPLQQFQALWQAIEAVKRQSAADQLTAIADNLALLRRDDPPAYERARRALEAALRQSA